MTKARRLTKDKSTLSYDAANPPAMRVLGGEVFQLETASILTYGDSVPESKFAVPVTGPVWVDGAKVGSALRIEVIRIELKSGRGAILSMPGRGAFGTRILEPALKVVTYDNKYVHFNSDIKFPLRPMVGKVAVAPTGGAINCHATGIYGGNMDITDIAEGSYVYLPVFVEGALLSCGDVHAAMGDGETGYSAVEAEALLTLRCDVIGDLTLTHPMVVTSTHVMTVGYGATLDEASHMALDDMVELVMRRLGLDYVDATRLVSVAADLKVNQICNLPAVGARVALLRSLLPKDGTP